MAVPIWVPGQVLASADINRWFVPQTAIKPGNTSRASTVTMTADPDLTLPVEASATYDVEILLHYDAGTASDFSFQFSAPAGAAMTLTTHGLSTVATDSSACFMFAIGQASPWGPNNHGGLGAGVNSSVLVRGTLTTGVTAGTLTVQWAQLASSATATILHAGSSMILSRIG